MVARDVTARILRRSRQLATPRCWVVAFRSIRMPIFVSYSSARSESST
jgi:hypothetical protein